MKYLRKKVFAVIFTLCVAVMSSIFFTNDMNEIAAGESEISKNVLSVKCQISENTEAQTSKLRIVSTIDNLDDYKMAGFDIIYGDKEIPYETTKAYQSIEAVSGGVDYTYSPNVFDIESKYFITVTLINLPLNDTTGILIKPYVVPVGGNEKVYGTHRYFSVADAKDNTVLSIPVEMTASSSATYTVTSGETTYSLETENSYYDDGTYTHFRIDMEDRTALKSVTTFTVSDGTNEYTAKYRNLNSTYSGDADTTWYDESSDYNVVATAADLYGFASLVNGGNQFTGETVYLGADVVLNSGDSSAWSEGTETPSYTWPRIGNGTSKYFAGTFNGQMHTISGIYVTGNIANVGLFGVTSVNTKIQNLVVANSYIKGDRAVGVIAGQGGGTFDTIQIEEDVYVTSAVLGNTANKGRWCGGIIGLLCPAVSGESATADKPNKISNCWFAGTLNAARYGGGIAGSVGKHVDNGTQSRATTIAVIEHCLNTGSVTHTGVSTTDTTARTGGLCGAIVSTDSSTYSTVTIRDSLNTGTVTSSIDNAKNYDCVYGHVYQYTHINLTGVYATSESYTTKGGNTNTTTTGSVNRTYSASNIKGFSGYDLENLTFTATDDSAAYWVVRANDTPALASLVDSAIRTIPSTTWHDESNGVVEDGITVYTISTLADLYGFSKLSADGETFAGEKIQLGANIKMNTGLAASWEKYAPDNEWIPIGSSTYPFAGTFDGQGHTISGLYALSATSDHIGLFGCTTVSANVKDLTINNTYFKGNNAVGAIAGEGGGTFDTIHVGEDVYVTSIKRWCGGIIGVLCPYVEGESVTAENPNRISNCWFAGTLKAGRYGGGMTGSIGKDDDAANNRTVTIAEIENCLNTGSVTHTGIAGAYQDSSRTRTGGLCGAVVSTDSSTYSTVTIKDSLNIGAVTSEITEAKNYGDIYGHVYNNTHIELTDVYATDSSSTGDGGIVQANCTITGDGTITRGFDSNEITGFSGYVNLSGLSYSNEYLPDAANGVWVAVEGSHPVLTSFSEGYTLVDFAPFVLGGDTIATMVDSGAGNAVITVSNNDSFYNTYIEKIAGKNGLGFELCNSNGETGLDNGAVLTSSYKKGELIITVTYVKNTKTTYISAGSTVELSPYLDEKTVTEAGGDDPTGETSLGMLQLENVSGSTYIIQLENGHFIVHDSGQTQTDYDNFVAYLESLAGDTKPVIDAWIISHGDADHYGILEHLNDSDGDGVCDDFYVEGIYFTEPSLAICEATGKSTSFAKIIRNSAKQFRTSSNEVAKLYRMYTGQKYYFDGATMEVLLTHEQLTDYTEFNETSVWCKYTIGSGAAAKTFMNGADSDKKGMAFIMSTYSPNYVYSDLFAALHHGAGTLADFTTYLQSNTIQSNCTAGSAILYSRSVTPTDASGYITVEETRREEVKDLNETMHDAVYSGVGENKFFYYGAGTVKLNFTSDGITGGYIQIAE